MSEREGLSGASAGYGSRLGETVGADEAPSVVTRSLQGAEVAVTEVRVDQPDLRLSDPIPAEDAYLICLMLRDLPSVSYHEGGRHVMDFPLRRDETTIYDLRREPGSQIAGPLHTLVWYLPRATIEALAQDAEVPRVDELRFQTGTCVRDDTIRHLGLSVLPGLRAPDQVNRLFADHMALALALHIAQIFGGMQIPAQPIQGGLAHWQERRAKEMLAGDLTGSTPLREVAAACGLSVNHLSRAFRRSTGLPPHAWLIEARLDAAKALLRERTVALSEIALSCGFADQTHFTRVFSARVGQSPGAWRRTALD